MPAPIVTNAGGSLDQRLMLASKLLSRTSLSLVCAQVCEKEKQEKGTGTIAYFTRYKRIATPIVTLTEGNPPTAGGISLERISVTLDQWGDTISISDVALKTWYHDLMAEAVKLLADGAQRVIDREIQLVWLAGTNVTYGNGTVTDRASITSAMTISDAIIRQIRVTLSSSGAQPFGGPDSNENNDAKQKGQIASVRAGRKYLAIAGPAVMADIQQPGTSLGTWASVSMYANAKALYQAEVGEWLGFRWVETNFHPIYTMLGNTTAAVTTGNSFGSNTPVVNAVDGGGTLTSATTYYFKVVRKSLLDGFADEISIIHSMASAATGNNESFNFVMPSTTGFVFDVYFGASNSDAACLLAASNVAAGATATVTAVPSGTAAAPANVNTTGTPAIHPVYFHGAGSVSWVGLQDLTFHITKDESTVADPLQQQRIAGYKFMHKCVIRNQLYLARLECASTMTAVTLSN